MSYGSLVPVYFLKILEFVVNLLAYSQQRIAILYKMHMYVAGPHVRDFSSDYHPTTYIILCFYLPSI